MTVGIELDRFRRKIFSKRDAFLHRFLDLLVIERIARRLDQTAAIDHRRTAPAFEQRREPRRPAFFRRCSALISERFGMRHELGGDAASSSSQWITSQPKAALRRS